MDEENKVTAGESSFDSDIPVLRGLPNLSGCCRCVPPQFSAPLLLQVSEICSQHKLLPVLNTAIQCLVSPLGIYKDAGGDHSQTQIPGIHLYLFLDDFLIRIPCQTTAHSATIQIVNLL